MFKKKLFGLSLIVLSTVFLFVSLSFADELGDIQKAIKEKGAKWVAGKTSMMMLTPEERRMRLGVDFTKGLRVGDGIPYQESFAAAPPSFDWRNIDGKETSYVTPIRNQGSCGSCWAFAATAALESYILMTQNMPNNIDLNLAEQILVSCYNPDGCSGGSPSGASSYIKSTGLPPEDMFPLYGLRCRGWIIFGTLQPGRQQLAGIDLQDIELWVRFGDGFGHQGRTGELRTSGNDL